MIIEHYQHTDSDTENEFNFIVILSLKVIVIH